MSDPEDHPLPAPGDAPDSAEPHGAQESSAEPLAVGPDLAPGTITPPSQRELDGGLTVRDRLELLGAERQRADAERERRRASRHQWFNSIGVLAGVLFTAGGLLVTALTFQTGQEELRTAKEGQVTDRYTKAVEQLGSGKVEVRTAAIYALERIAKDSDQDRVAIRDVLAAFTREHDPDTNIKDNKLPTEPDTDVQAALTVLGRRSADPPSASPLDLHAIRTPAILLSGNANLTRANLTRANLDGANLTSANLSHTKLTNADLTNANLTDTDLSYANLFGAGLVQANLTSAYLASADLTRANLSRAHLSRANLSRAHLTSALLHNADLTSANLSRADLTLVQLFRANLSKADLNQANLSRADLRYANLTGFYRGANLSGANLTGANLSGANLSGADLSGADLSGADLTSADLSGADLTGANLTGANLSGTVGMTEAEVRQAARTDAKTMFGPLP